MSLHPPPPPKSGFIRFYHAAPGHTPESIISGGGRRFVGRNLDYVVTKYGHGDLATVYYVDIDKNADHEDDELRYADWNYSHLQLNLPDYLGRQLRPYLQGDSGSSTSEENRPSNIQSQGQAMPLFLPVIASVLARGAAVLGRVAVGAGRAISSVGGRFGQSVGRAVQRGGAAMQRGAGGATSSAGGSPFRSAVQPGRPAGRRRVTPAGQGGRRRRGAQRQKVSFSQAFRQAARQGARQSIVQQRARAGAPQLIQRIFSPQSPLGKMVQNFGSAKMNFKQGNMGAAAMDAGKIGLDVAKPMIAAGVALATFPKIAKEFGAAVIESRRALAEYNAVHSVALGRLEIGRFSRQVRTGAATGGSFRNLTQSQNRLEEKLLPYQIMGINLLNRVVTLLTNMAVSGVNAAEGAGNAATAGAAMLVDLKAIKEWLLGSGNVQNQPLADLAQALGRGNFQQRVRPPMPPMNNAPPPGRQN